MSCGLHVSLQRYRTGDVPKRQRRLCEGRSNAATLRQQERDALTRAVVPHMQATQPRAGEQRQRHATARAVCQRDALTLSEQQVRSGFCSTFAAACAAHARHDPPRDTSACTERSCVYTSAQMRTMLRTVAPELLTTQTHTAALLSPPSTTTTTTGRTIIRCPPSSHALPHRATTDATVAAPTHPVVAALLYDNDHGKGHTLHPDDFFFSAAHATAAYDVGAGSDGGHYKRSGDDGASVQHPPPAPTPPPLPHVNAAGGQLERDSPDTDEQWCRSKVVAHRHIRRDRHAAGRHPHSNSDKSEDEAHRRGANVSAEARDAWVHRFTPSVQPYKVERCLGRCGRTDYRLTFDDVQPSPLSDMYASPAERFRTVQRVPLATPNNWQAPPRRGRDERGTAYEHVQ